MTLDLSVLEDAVGTYSQSQIVGHGKAARAPVDAFDESPCNPRFENDAAQFELLVEDVRARGLCNRWWYDARAIACGSVLVPGDIALPSPPALPRYRT